MSSSQLSTKLVQVFRTGRFSSKHLCSRMCPTLLYSTRALRILKEKRCAKASLAGKQALYSLPPGKTEYCGEGVRPGSVSHNCSPARSALSAVSVDLGTITEQTSRTEQTGMLASGNVRTGPIPSQCTRYRPKALPVWVAGSSFCGRTRACLRFPRDLPRMGKRVALHVDLLPAVSQSRPPAAQPAWSHRVLHSV